MSTHRPGLTAGAPETPELTTEEKSLSLFETLKTRCAAEWDAYTRHDFV